MILLTIILTKEEKILALICLAIHNYLLINKSCLIGLHRISCLTVNYFRSTIGNSLQIKKLIVICLYCLVDQTLTKFLRKIKPVCIEEILNNISVAIIILIIAITKRTIKGTSKISHCIQSKNNLCVDIIELCVAYIELIEILKNLLTLTVFPFFIALT